MAALQEGEGEEGEGEGWLFWSERCLEVCEGVVCSMVFLREREGEGEEVDEGGGVFLRIAIGGSKRCR